MKKGQAGSGVFYKSMISCLIMIFAGLLWLCPQTQALEIYQTDGLRIQLDSTVSYGLMWRAGSRDKDIVGLTNGGTKHSVNLDDGNLNYDNGGFTDPISSAFKLTSELDVDAGWIGFFGRASGFYDIENERGNRERTPLSSAAKDEVGSDISLLDCYLWVSQEVLGIPFQIRVGEQVVSWGESTFIQHSINSINSIDVAKIRVPGAELKEALTPEGMVWATISPTENFSIEGFYEYDWEETKLDPSGTYFNGADFIGAGGQKLMLGFGAVPDQGDAPVAETFMGVPRGKTDAASNQGQYGVAVRYYSEALHSTEFSAYAMNYHHHIFNMQVQMGDLEALQQAGAAAAAAGAAAGAAAFKAALAAGKTPAEAGAIAAATGKAVGGAVAVDQYAKASRYLTHYEEDQKLYGVAFNTEVATIGWQGEISYRPDAPLQIDDLELLQAFLSPLNPTYGETGQLGQHKPGDLLEGFIEKDIIQVQSTLTYLLPPLSWLGSEGGLLIGEVGWEHICGMPSKDKLRLEGPGTVTPGGATGAVALRQPQTASKHFADEDSWGYRILAKLEFYNVLGPIGLTPRLGWSHDVSGISPLGGPFMEDRKALTMGLEANYLSSWTADLSYTNYMGGGSYNVINDRDFIGFNVKYTF
ncbi:MAG: DUF1302 domain-containing protein [Deltaproteobacteria bacterium]|nr:DUF1302 domain-containing protein [Deltaproteobacteria bacterium]